MLVVVSLLLHVTIGTGQAAPTAPLSPYAEGRMKAKTDGNLIEPKFWNAPLDSPSSSPQCSLISPRRDADGSDEDFSDLAFLSRVVKQQRMAAADGENKPTPKKRKKRKTNDQKTAKQKKKACNFRAEYIEGTSQVTFKRMFRLSILKFEEVLEKIKTHITKDTSMGRAVPTITPNLTLGVTLAYLRGGSYIDIAAWSDISHASIYSAVRDVVDAIIIEYPLSMWAMPYDDAEALEEMSNEFTDRSANGVIEGCVGAVDGLLVHIWSPSDVDNPGAYFCRKKFYAINFLCMCDAQRRFRYVSGLCPGATNDAHAYSISSLHAALSTGALPSPYWIAGDAAFPLSNSVLIPYRGRGLPEFEDAYNYYQSQVRMNIECAFGMLVNKFGIFWRPMRGGAHRAVALTTACMILHNLCIDDRMGTDAPFSAASVRPVERVVHDEHAPPDGRPHFRDAAIVYNADAPLPPRPTPPPPAHPVLPRAPATTVAQRRERVASRIARLGATRPSHSKKR